MLIKDPRILRKTELISVVLLDSTIIEAKMEMKEVTRFLNIKDNTAQFNKEKGRRKVEIQEVKAMKSLRGPRRSPLAALLLRGGHKLRTTRIL